MTLQEILTDGLLRSAFQPIVDLETGRLAGFEALVRGPRDSEFEQPDQLLAEARAQDQLAQLDAACQATAVKSAHAQAIRYYASMLAAKVRPADRRRRAGVRFHLHL